MDLGVGRRVGYVATRRLLTAAGVAVLAASAAVLYSRRVETAEVVAVLLFVPVYVAVVLRKVPGGLLAGAAAALAYGALRRGALDTLSTAQVTSLVASRAVAYLVFGGVGGAAVHLLEESLVKLDRHDVIDDATGLHNARFLGRELDLELSRAARYGSSFSTLVAEIPAAPLRVLPRRRRSALLRGLGAAVDETLRTVDRSAAGVDGDCMLVVALLPETPEDGATTVADRLAERLAVCFADAGADIGRPQVHVVSHPSSRPDDGAAVTALRARLVAVDASEHPESPFDGVDAGRPAAAGRPGAARPVTVADPAGSPAGTGRGGGE